LDPTGSNPDTIEALVVLKEAYINNMWPASVRDVRGGAAAGAYSSLPSRRGSGSLFFVAVAARQRLNFWKFFVCLYRKNL